MKKFLTTFLLLITITSFVLVVRMVIADSAMAALEDELQGIKTTTQLPTFEIGHPQAALQSGASQFTSAIYYTLDFMKFMIGGIAVVMIIITGLQLIIARKKIDDVWNKQKERLIMITVGFVLILIADVVVKNVFFGVQGEVFESPAQAQLAAEQGVLQLKGIYNIALMAAGVLAVAMMVIAGFKLLVSGGNEDAQTKVKKQITWLIIGLFLLGVAEFVVQDFIFPKAGSTIPDVEKGKQLIVNFTNFVSGFVIIGSIIVGIYSGYIYITAVGNEEKTTKAKKALTGAVIGMILALGAFAIVNTLIKFTPGT